MKKYNAKKLPHLYFGCSNDDYRPAMAQVYFKNGIGYASDAHIMLCADMRETGLDESELKLLEGKLIHKEAYKLLCTKSTFCAVEEDGILGIFEGYRTKFLFSKDLTYPNANEIFINALKKPRLEMSIIGINFNLSKPIQSFFNKSGVSSPLHLNFINASDPIIITTPETSRLFALQMPVMVNNKISFGILLNLLERE